MSCLDAVPSDSAQRTACVGRRENFDDVGVGFREAPRLRQPYITRYVPTYRLHDTTGDDLGLIEHPAPNVEPGDEVIVPDRREALVIARVEAQPGPLPPRRPRLSGRRWLP